MALGTGDVDRHEASFGESRVWGPERISVCRSGRGHLLPPSPRLYGGRGKEDGCAATDFEGRPNTAAWVAATPGRIRARTAFAPAPPGRRRVPAVSARPAGCAPPAG